MKVNTITNHHEVSFCRRHDALFLPFLLSLLSLTTISASILLSTYVSADDNSTVDQISITVPMSCTMSGTGQDSHNANINNGTYTPDIGTTTLHAFCNDNEGFAIYAAGYTNDEIGGENSNKLVGTNASGNSTIESGLATVAGTPDISNWAMKLAITQDSGDTTGTNAFTIDSAPNVTLPSQAEQSATPASFSSYHVVPNEYVKVAHKNSVTDMTTSTGGVKLTTTYAAYISKTQPADTYTGQVIYTLVHPSTITPVLLDQVGVMFHGNGQTFAGGRATNQVIYGDFYRPMHTTATPEIIETSNLINGEQNGGYTDSEYILETRTFNGASRIKVEVKYSITRDSAMMGIFNEPWNGDWDSWKDTWESYGGIGGNDDMSGTRTFIIDGDTVTIYAETWNVPEPGYDYGFSAKIYPLYTSEQENTIPLPAEYYVGNTPEIIKTSNISESGTQNGSYTDSEYILETRTFNDASRIKVEVKYDITGNSALMRVFDGPWDGDSSNWKDNWANYGGVTSGDDMSGTRTFIIDGNTVTIYAESKETPKPGHDYGFYVQVYPLYEIKQENTTSDNLIKSFGPQVGTYAEPANCAGWQLETGQSKLFFSGETEIMKYIKKNEGSLKGAVIDVYAYITTELIMQNAGAWKDNLALEQQVEAIDIRDGKKYMIAKLADGNIWMTQNLDLDLDSNVIYTNFDTDLGWNSSTDSYDMASWTPMRSTYETSSNNSHGWCDGGRLVSHGEDCQNNTPESYDPGDLYWNREVSTETDWISYYNACDSTDEPGEAFLDCDETQNPLSTHTTTSSTAIKQYYLGNYYNWPAAIASNDASIYETHNLEVHQSICPSGWRLPRKGTNEETGEIEDGIQNLWKIYGINSEYDDVDISALWSTPIYYVPSGGFSIDFFAFYSSLVNIGYGGYFWTSVSGWGNNAYSASYNLGEYSIPLYDLTSGTGAGHSVRCVLRSVSD